MFLPTVSIIMPAYNSAKYIIQSIKSIIAQSYDGWELLVIDDCSTDNTYSLAQKIAANNEKICLFRNKENLGVSKTRNFGISQARGEWIAFIDSDDIWTSDKLQKQMDLIGKTPEAKLVFSASGFIDENGNNIQHILHVPEIIDKKQLLKQNVISCSSVLVKKEYVDKFPFCDKPTIHEDYVTWLRILEVEPYAHGIDEPLLIYRVTTKSKSGNKIKAAMMQWNAYKEVGIGGISRMYNMLFYAVNGIAKYHHLAGKEK